MSGEPDIAVVAGLFADRSRARVLMALMDGRSLPASVLAAEAGVTPQAMSSHLAKLRAEHLITMERSGRHRYYAIAGPQVAAALESLAAIAPIAPVTSLRQGTRAQRLRAARTCYDHLAGALGVAVTQALIAHSALSGPPSTARRPDDQLSAPLHDSPYELGPSAGPVLADLGVDLAAVCTSRRPLLRFCVDWTEQRHHLAGALGAALADAFLAGEWTVRRPHTRELRITQDGAVALKKHLGLDVDPTA